MREGRVIQDRLSNSRKMGRKAKSNIDRMNELIENGKIGPAGRCIGEEKTGLLEINDAVINTLKEKHPEAADFTVEGLISGPLPEKLCEDVLFEGISPNLIRRIARDSSGGAGPDGISGDLMRKMLTSKQHGKAPDELCQAVADLAKYLNRKKLPSHQLQAFKASRLIPLDKKPGVRPIGIGQAIRRMVARASMTLLKEEIIKSYPAAQTCGRKGGAEAMIHATRRKYGEKECEGCVIVDARNCYNIFDRRKALHNIQYTCPKIHTLCSNLYGGGS